ncbi:galactose-specific lectin nattectin-like [Periophthalmus magnuspinnatus]|uniref:galactose-specific lectin nattectin-like n=1 Tax=Periophthalmus magnuspinnatus TaxID=409849 RepID=UPI00145B3B7F|nr:galactose-specific lectin nattectin-like [Periophthalmus magnuspinnatus]
MALRGLLIVLGCLAIDAGLTIPAVTSAPPVAGGDQGCPDGWTRFESRCFKFFNEKKSWINAEKICHSLGANLPSIHSLEQNRFIMDMIVKSTGTNSPTWLGGTDAVEEGKWLWSDGSVWDFTHWPPSGSQPDNAAGKEHCLMMNWDATFWNDAPNSWSLVYICTKDVLQPTPTPNIVSLTLEGFICRCTPEKK